VIDSVLIPWAHPERVGAIEVVSVQLMPGVVVCGFQEGIQRVEGSNPGEPVLSTSSSRASNSSWLSASAGIRLRFGIVNLLMRTWESN
jgi:hypothetical protein